MDFKEAQEQTRKLVEVLEKEAKPWNPIERFADLVEEVGELANALLVEEGVKNKGRLFADLKDSLCDILFDMLTIANHYGIDLSKEYRKVLKDMEKRIERKEFND
jgi:NTP pyrophosphatase (non-canonical NTP hydrolase)